MPLRTPLYEFHREAGARFVEFAGWEMPLQYSGIIEEHLTVRKSVGLFDVSHMGKIFIEGPDAHRSLDFLSANAIPTTPGRARYTHLPRDDGTTLDDVIVTCLAPTRYFMVCNAGPREAVLDWLRAHQSGKVVLRDRTIDFLCLALQGPRSASLLQRFTSVDLSKIKSFGGAVIDFVPPAPWGSRPRAVPPEIVGWGSVEGAGPAISVAEEPSVSDGRTAFLITRTGYTGEDGFELFPDARAGPSAWRSLLDAGSDLNMKPVGLGARDTLRLEKGYLLSGQDFDGHQTPFELNCEWIVKWDRPFLGRDSLLAQKARDDYRRLVGLRMEDRGIPRHACKVLTGGREVGAVSSGTQSPSLRVGIALASVEKALSDVGTALEVDIRGTPHPAHIAKLPFV